MSEILYQVRPVTVINVLDHDVEILKPESVVLSFKCRTKARESCFDIGSLCYRLRRSKFAGRVKNASQDTKITEVVLGSKEEWRVDLINSIIEHIRTQVVTKTSDTVTNILKVLINFFEYCEAYDDLNQRTQTFDGFLLIYTDYTDSLRHRIKLAPNNPQYMKMSSAASKQRIVRRFLQYRFNKSEVDIIRHVPSIRRGRDKTSVVSAPDSNNRDEFIKFATVLFYGLADGILNQDYAPIELMLPIKDKMVRHLYSDPTDGNSILLNKNLSWPSFSSKEPIADEIWINAEPHYRQRIRNATNQAKAYRSLSSPSYFLSKTYLLAQSAFIACFYAATAINASPLIHLEETSEVPKTLRGMRFSGLKARAGNKTIYPEFGNDFQIVFDKFRALRSYIMSYFGDEPLWFFRPKFNLKKLDADSTLTPLKTFIIANNFNIPILTPTQIRKGVAIDFLKLSRGDLVITSKKLGNTINTVTANYAKNDPLEQNREFSDFYQEMYQSALKRARPNDILVSVLEAGDNDFNIPVGHCSNVHNKAPHRIEAFSEFSPQPDCSRPETCLFCKHYSIVPDKEDIGKLLGLKELINLVKTNIGSSDKYVNILAPVFYRINEIIDLIRNMHQHADVIITEVQGEIERGVLHPFWEEHYEFLIDLGAPT